MRYISALMRAIYQCAIYQCESAASIAVTLVAQKQLPENITRAPYDNEAKCNYFRNLYYLSQAPKATLSGLYVSLTTV